MALVVGAALAWPIAEIGVRLVGHTDADGNFFVAGVHVKPYRLPVERLRSMADKYEASSKRCKRYSPRIGWGPRPDCTSKGGRYRYDANGIRTGEGRLARSKTRSPGVHRIALFGDSFTHSNEVPFEHSWGDLLERRSSNVEILNFGFGAYGFDQAYWRWLEDGKAFEPDVVLFGFQAENVLRNTNIVRILYFPKTGLPFSKPRFVLEDGALLVVNRPALPPAALVATVAGLHDWQLRHHEAFYRDRDYVVRPWSFSRLLALGVESVARDQQKARHLGSYDLETATGRLALAILDAFAKDVIATGADFRIVHLPRKPDLASIRDGRPLAYQALLDRVAERYRVIEPTGAFLDAASQVTLDDLFAPLSHYSKSGNQVLAEFMAREIARGAVVTK